MGTLLTKDGDDLLGPYTKPKDQWNATNFNCNNGSGRWFAKSYYAPSWMYAFQLTKQCEYQFRTPEGKILWETVRDVNSWFEQAAKTFQRPGNKGYKVDSHIGNQGMIFSGGG